MAPSNDGDKTIAQLDSEAIEKFNKKLKESFDREAKMQRHHLWRGNKIVPFNIEHMPFPRQRLAEPMTAEDRFLRKQWLADQVLSPNEPRFIPELYPRNAFRRFFGKPWDVFFDVLKPIIGESRAFTGRFFVPKFAIAIGIGYGIYYHMKYNYNTWENRHGWNIYGSKPPVYNLQDSISDKEGDDFYDRGFKNRSVLRN
ncbi:hypothetical protein HELRODRAFT_185877 [Helobdella robusta]|uniref:Uncharacterized protein n=1 Tax=Helobdella robusta TaxID=6412 RepID=T1FNE0_HELRO|nr:hypothetical protein HELRODRAFT_185877 [Helobdella robusta]ESN98138.1 hypothetical protein HELRODRAFT_185877 [Helobdella robusta]